MREEQAAISPSKIERGPFEGQVLSSQELEEAIKRLRTFCESTHFRGYDPYDALRSPLLRTCTRPSRWLRIAAVQFLRRSPLNLRPILGISKDYNPKGMGLFLKAYITLRELSADPALEEEINFFADWLAENRSPGFANACWGYNFDWQSSLHYFPMGTPTLVNTAYIADAFLDLYHVRGEERFLALARSACDFVLRDIGRSEDGRTFCFSYSPLDRLRVHNANMLGASLLARVYQTTGEAELQEAAQRATAYTLAHQRINGSWPYGEGAGMGHIDSFHTGFVLESLYRIAEAFAASEYQEPLKRGLLFYSDHFFLPDGTPKYLHNRIYPIDIHSAAQGILTYAQLATLDGSYLQEASRIARWTITNMRRPDGAFCYRVGRLHRNRIPYIRWGQAWTLLALSVLQVIANDKN